MNQHPIEQQDNPQESDLRFVNEMILAETLCLSERTLQDWRRRGIGPPFYRFGRSVRYRLDEALTWAKKRRLRSTWR